MWSWSGWFSGTKVDAEHTALDRGAEAQSASGDDECSSPQGSSASSGEARYWHMQDITASDTTLVVSRGLRDGLAMEAVIPLRHVTNRIRFEDAAGQLFHPRLGDIHHRNETLAGPGDPWLMLHGARVRGAWTVAARAGLSIPLGSTVENPFALGERGLRHQHVQFGTGTWDPLLGLGAARQFGEVSLSLLALARLTVYENSHGYRAGHRYYMGAAADRRLRGAWRATAGLDLNGEQAEHWSGRQRAEEGNLGRTDLLFSIGLRRDVAKVGAFSLTGKVPIVTRTVGSQLDYPAIIDLGWSR